MAIIILFVHNKYSFMLYTRLLTFTQDSSFLMRSFRQLVSDLNAPIVWLFWAILLLVGLDIIGQLAGNSTKYGYLVGKVMIEAFFYSLFFAIWSEVFSNNWKSNFKRLNQIKNIKQHALKPTNLIRLYIIMNNIFVIYYASVYICISYCIFSGCLFYKVSSFIMSCSVNDSHVYINSHSTNNKQCVDAIIKWEYSEKPQSNGQWIMLN